jgi:hypothetical protein
MKKLSFKEYYESKQQLLKASANLPQVTVEYVVKKYCKIPIQVEGDGKDYVALKPKDVVRILWEFPNPKSASPSAKNMLINEQPYLPSWSSDKLNRWVSSMAEERAR